MLVTEEQAGSKWCPHVRATIYARGNAPELPTPINVVGHGANRITTDDPDIDARIADVIDATKLTRCIGPKCMAWRWHGPNGRYDAGQKRLGYCGAGNGAVFE